MLFIDGMMKHRSVILLLLIILICLAGLFSCRDVSQSVIQTPQLAEFIKNSGFVGDYKEVKDGRIVSSLNGKFNLPIPKDSISIQANMDKIAGELNAIYQEQGANYILKRTNYDDKYNSCQYVQYWKQFNLVNQPHYLLITYYTDNNTYSLQNTLYMKPISIPDKIVNLSTVKHILEIIADKYRQDVEFSGFQKEYIPTENLQTINRFKEVEYSYDGLELLSNYEEEDYTNLLFLNLFPVTDKSESNEYSLQWKYHKLLSDRPDIQIDAKTGSLIGNHRKEWQDRALFPSLVKSFISDNNLAGNCTYRVNNNDYLVISGIKAPEAIKDTMSYKQVTDKYTKALLKKYDQYGMDIKVGYQDTKISGNENGVLYYATYIQQLRYPVCNGDDLLKYKILYTLNTLTGIMDIQIHLVTQPQEYPAKILAPQAIIDITQLICKYAPDSEDFVIAYNKISTNKVSINTVPFNNHYTDSKAQRTAGLRIIPIYCDDSQTEKEYRLAWYVNDINGSQHGIYNPETGKPLYGSEQGEYRLTNTDGDKQTSAGVKHFKMALAFLRMGKAGKFIDNTLFPEYHSFEVSYNFPKVKDLNRFNKKSRKIINILLKLNHLDTPDYTYKYDRKYNPKYHKDDNSNDNERRADLYYKGFWVVPPIGVNLNNNITMEYNGTENKYFIKSYLKPLKYEMPGSVINPQTAWSISQDETNLQYVWTELSNISGTMDYAPPNQDFSYRGFQSLYLRFYPIEDENSVNKIEYKLIWLVFSNSFPMYKIDAVTGEIYKDKIREFPPILY